MSNTKIQLNNETYIVEGTNKGNLIIIFIHFCFLCPMDLNIKLNFNLSKRVSLTAVSGSVYLRLQEKVPLDLACAPELSALQIPLAPEIPSTDFLSVCWQVVDDTFEIT